MTKPSKAAGILLLFFGLMFFVPGLLSLFAFLKNSRSGTSTIAGAAIAVFFCCIGGLLLFSAFYGYRALQAQADREAANPSSPWLWRKDWAIRRADSANKNKEIGAWILCLLGNMFLLPFAIAMLPALWRQGHPAVIAVLAFVCVGPILVCYALRATFRHRRFGNTYFEFYALPFSPGDRLSGRIHLRLDSSADHGINLRLSCVRKTVTGTGNSRSTVQTLLWQADQKVSSGALGMDPAGKTIPVDFEIPADAYVTDHDSSSDQVLWLLHAQADVPGINYSDDFEVPVFRTSSSPAPASASASGSAFGFASLPSEADSSPVAAPENPKVIISSQAGGTEFYFPAFRAPSQAMFLLIFTVVWSGVVLFLFRSNAPWFFPAIFGFMDVLLIIASFRMLFGTSRIRVGNGEICWTSRVLGVGSTRRFPFGEIESVLAVTSGQMSGNQANPDYCVRLVTKNGRRYTLAGQISSSQEARWIVSQIETLAGLKIDTHVQVDSVYGPPPQPVQFGSNASSTPFGSSATPGRAVQVTWRGAQPQSTTVTIISFALFGACVAAMFAWQGWRFSNFRSRSDSARANRAAVPKVPPRRIYPSMTDADAERIQALPAQEQAEELLERAIGHDPRALDLFGQDVESWVGHIRLTEKMKQLERRSEFSTDLRVRYANADINLTLDGWQKNEEAADLLIERAKMDLKYRAAAVYFLGMLAGRGVAYDRIHPVLLSYAKYDPDATVRQWAVEGIRYLGKDEALDELFESFTQDPAMSVRNRAGCNISDCGTFTRAQRMRMVPKLLDLISDQTTEPQMRAWSFMALHEITDMNLGGDPQAWKSWYRDHGAEKLAELQALDWWQVHGEE